MPMPDLCFPWYYYILLLIPSGIFQTLLMCCIEYRFHLEQDCELAVNVTNPNRNPQFGTIVMSLLIPTISRSPFPRGKTEHLFIESCDNHFKLKTIELIRQYLKAINPKNFEIESAIFDILFDYSHTFKERTSLGYCSLFESRFKMVQHIRRCVHLQSYINVFIIGLYTVTVIITQAINFFVLISVIYPAWHDENSLNKQSGDYNKSFVTFEGFNTMWLMIHPTCKVFQYVASGAIWNMIAEDRGSFLYEVYMGDGWNAFGLDDSFILNWIVVITIGCLGFVFLFIHILPTLFIYYIPSVICFIAIALPMGAIFACCVLTDVFLINKLTNALLYSSLVIQCRCCYDFKCCKHKCCNLFKKCGRKCQCMRWSMGYMTPLIVLLFFVGIVIAPYVLYGFIANLYVDAACWYRGHEWSDCVLYAFAGSYCQQDTFDPFVYFDENSDWKSRLIGIAMWL